MKASIGSSGSVLVCLVGFDLVLSLLVDGLLVQHVEGCLTVARAHHSRSVVDRGREEPGASFKGICVACGIQKGHFAPTHVSNVAVGGREVTLLPSLTPSKLRGSSAVSSFAVIISLEESGLRIGLTEVSPQQLLALVVHEALPIETHFVVLLFLLQLLNLLLFPGLMLALILQKPLRAVSLSFLLGIVIASMDLYPWTESAFCKLFVEFVVLHLQSKLLLLQGILLLSSFDPLLEVLVGSLKSALVTLVVFVLHLIPASFEDIKRVRAGCLVHSIRIFPRVFGFHHLLVQV